MKVSNQLHGGISLRRNGLMHPEPTHLQLPNFTPHEIDVFAHCISTTSAEIHILLCHISEYKSNLLTISRCLKHNLRHVKTGKCSLTESELVDICHAVDSLFRDLAPKLSRESSFKAQCPSSQINRSDSSPKGEDTVPKPTSLDRNVLDLYIEAEKSRLDIKLHLLVLTKAEFNVEVDILNGELEFWVGVWKDVNSWADRGKRKLPQSPYPGVWEKHERVFLVGCYSKGIPRKDVRVNQMLKKAKRRAWMENWNKDALRRENILVYNEPRESLKRTGNRQEDSCTVKSPLEGTQTSKFPVDRKPSKDSAVDMQFDTGLLKRVSHEIHDGSQVKVLPAD